MVQFGFLGTHCKAPNSIMAWLNTSGFSLQITSKASSVNSFLALADKISVVTLKYLESTRNTFPSTTGTISWKENEAIAAAVYSPTPFNFNKS